MVWVMIGASKQLYIQRQANKYFIAEVLVLCRDGAEEIKIFFASWCRWFRDLWKEVVRDDVAFFFFICSNFLTVNEGTK